MLWMALVAALLTQDSIPAWIEQLGDEKPSAREDAQAKLIEAGSKAEASLKAALDHSDSEVRTRVRFILEHLAPDLELVREFESAHRFAFDVDSSRIAYYGKDGSIRVVSLGDGKERTIEGEGPSVGIPPAFSPDGKVLAAELKPGRVSFLDVGSWKESCSVEIPPRRWGDDSVRPIHSALTSTGTLVTLFTVGSTFCSTDGKSNYDRSRLVLVTPDGNSFVALQRDQLISGDTLQFQRRLRGESAEYGAHALVPSGDWKVLVTLNESDTLQIFDRDGLTRRASHSIEGPRVLALASNRKGSWLALGRQGGKLELWEASTMRKAGVSLDLGSDPIQTAWSRDGRWLGVSIDGKINLFRPNIRYR